MATIILHHYDASPFSEKVRVCLGIKQLEWLAVEQPVIMPKPALLPLTGGYRRIPVMQIGADVWLDSVAIVAELERRHPAPTLFPGGTGGLATALQYWTDREVFQAAVGVIFGGLGDKVDPAFIKDREALSGRPFDTQAMAAAVPYLSDQFRAHAALLSAQLADGRAFLEGAAPGLADATAWYNLWFVRAAFPPATALFADLPHLGAWLDRVAALGHGTRVASTPDEALAIATAHEPDPALITAATDHPLLGKPVIASATDYGRDPVAGELVGVSAQLFSLSRHDPHLGQIHVHLPRIGYALSPAG